MRNIIISLILLFGVGHPAVAEEALQDNPPEKHVVVKGDTLWSIAARFLKEPWRWPEVWNLNREQIKNPHLIFPGNVIVLSMKDGKPQLQLENANPASRLETVKLSPRTRSEILALQAIPSISPAIIGPFLSQPLIIDDGELERAPEIVGTEEHRVVVGAGNRIYASGMGREDGLDWNIYRPGKILADPDTREILGREAVYLGRARVSRFGDSTTLDITKSVLEINRRDKLVPVTEDPVNAYVPHAPERAISGSIIAAYGGVAEVGQNAIVTINLGQRDGLEVGHVLAIYRRGITVPTVDQDGKKVALKLPDERSGLMFVFRTFSKVSYALIVQSSRPVHMLDVVQTP
ncbi:MAG: LysM peptidoglycan-binding domain-containing protein [Sulfuricella sp.]|nr:LysM peptidoglycan-binding domain-containing protein [Sulfuricella sp.]